MSESVYDVAIVGCGIAGMATALRLQAKGYATIILEAHGQPGGCAGFYTKKGFSFDVGATTMVDFDHNGVGGELFQSVGISLPESEKLDYKLWLPDREVHMYNDREKWDRERLAKFGTSTDHIAFWKFMDHLADVFWNASRTGIKLPVQNLTDIVNGIRCVGAKNLPLTRYLNWTFLDALKKFNLEHDIPLRSAMGMLIEDTVHSSVEQAPLINAALGITIRGAGLRRARGGMKGLWDHLVQAYHRMGGRLRLGNRVTQIDVSKGVYTLESSKGRYRAAQVVSALPLDITHNIINGQLKNRFKKYLSAAEKRGGAIVVFLGVPEEEVTNQELTHHQLLYNYNRPLGDGNNMFVSVSSPGDLKSAPEGYRSVMISTHCNLDEWQNLDDVSYSTKKQETGEQLVNLARKIYPDLGAKPAIYQVGTPRTYYKYTGRRDGAVGGFKQTITNSNLKAIPHDIGIPNFRLVGDSTWPGLGTVACILGSRIVAQQIQKQ